MANATAPAALSRLQTLRGLRLWIWCNNLGAIQSAICAGVYATGYARHLNATEAMIGILSAAPLLAAVLQIFSPLISERSHRRKPFILVCYAFGYLVWVPIALIPFAASHQTAAWGMIVMVFCGGAAFSLAQPAASSWFTDLVPQEIRGRYVARNQSLLGVFALVATIAAGRYLDLFSASFQQTGFASLFIVACGFALASLVLLALVPEPPVVPSRQKVSWRLLALPLQHRDFSRLTGFVMAFGAAQMVAGPFFTVLQLDHLQMSFAQIAVLQSVVTVMTILSYPIWGYLADKFGNKPLLRLGIFGIAVYPLPWFFATATNYPWVLVPTNLWGGATAAALVVSQYNLLLRIAPQERRSVYLGFFTAMVNIASSIGAVVGGLLASRLARLGPFWLFGHPLSHLQVLFLFSVGFRLLSLSLLQRVHEPQEVTTRDLLRQVGRGNPLLTLWSLFRLQRSADPAAKARATRALGSAGSPLAVDELTKVLEDSDREVRREAARALGEIGDERATMPLLTAALDETTGIVEDAVDALGKVGSPRSVPALLELLADERPSVRQSAVIALGNFADAEASAALDRVLETETDPSVFLAAVDAVSRLGGRRALHRLRALLPRCTTLATRRQLAHAIGNLLGPVGEFYSLLEAETMQQEEAVAKLLRRTGRRVRRARLLDAVALASLVADLEQALRLFEHRDYDRMLALLRHLAGVAVRAAAGVGERGGGREIAALLQRDPVMRLSYGLLNSLARDTRDELRREGALLAVYATSRLVDGLATRR